MRLTQRPFRPRRLPAAAGVTLLEVLLTLVILSIGLLGIGAMQIIGLKSGNTANFRSAATLVAAEMAERIRANPDAVAGIGLDPVRDRFANVTKELDPMADCSVVPAPYCSSWINGSDAGAVATCGPQAMANFDINVMYCGGSMDAGNATSRTSTGLLTLPNGRMTIVCTDAACAAGSGLGFEHIVTVTWDERPTGSDAGTTPVQRSVAIAFVPN